MIGATLFSGGRGVETLLTDAIDFRLAVEYDAAIAAVGAQLGGETIVSKVEDVDYTTWPALNYLHASPVCKEYSQVKSGGAEGESDLSSAAPVVRCLEATQPRVFTLENVGAYQHGQAYRRICAWLNHNGYMWHAEVLNSADFAVPQTRRRLILRAVRDALLPPLPAPEPWVGWYAAIEDLIPTLPESAFAPWQEIRLKVKIYGEIYEKATRSISRNSTANDAGRAMYEMRCGECAGCTPQGWRPCEQCTRKLDKALSQLPYETARHTATLLSVWGAAEGAWLLQQAFASISEVRRSAIHEDQGCRAQEEADDYRGGSISTRQSADIRKAIIFAFTQSEDCASAFVMRGENAAQEWGRGGSRAPEPIETVTGSNSHRAFIVEGQTGSDGSYVNVRGADSPLWTISASMERRPARAWLNTEGIPQEVLDEVDRRHERVWLIESKNANQQYGDGARRGTEPATTVVTDHKPSHQPKAWLSQGRVVRMTPRALARFQSFPDWYELPGKAALACTVIGNAVPPLLMSKIVRQLL